MAGRSQMGCGNVCIIHTVPVVRVRARAGSEIKQKALNEDSFHLERVRFASMGNRNNVENRKI